MLLARIKMWLIMAAVLASGAASAFGQADEPVGPFGPSNIRYDLELFKAPDLSAYADWPRPKEGFFFQYDRLFWAIQQPSRTAIGVPGGVGVGLRNGVINFDNTNQPVGDILSTYGNSLDTGFLRAKQTWGNRFELGFMEDDKGWFVSIMNIQNQVQTYSAGSVAIPAGLTIVFRDPRNLLMGFVDTNGDGFDDDLNISGPITPFNRVPSVFGRPTGAPPVNLDTNGDGVPDSFAGFTDFGDEVKLVPYFNTIVAQNTTSINSVEVNRSWRYPISHNGGIWQLNLGVRWIILRDSFNVTATDTLATETGGTTPTTTGPIAQALPGVSFWDTSVDNNMFGPQIGVRYDHQVARWDIMADLRFMAAINFQSIHMNGELASELDPIPSQTLAGGSGALNPINVPFNMVRTSFHNWQYDETFAPVGELRVGVGYQLTNAISVQAGYNAILGGGVSRASRRIDYVLPALQILNANKNDAWFVDGLNIGITCNR
jgi:Putative beta barrel porin-7 (BBP7)